MDLLTKAIRNGLSESYAHLPAWTRWKWPPSTKCCLLPTGWELLAPDAPPFILHLSLGVERQSFPKITGDLEMFGGYFLGIPQTIKIHHQDFWLVGLDHNLGKWFFNRMSSHVLFSNPSWKCHTSLIMAVPVLSQHPSFTLRSIQFTCI